MKKSLKNRDFCLFTIPYAVKKQLFNLFLILIFIFYFIFIFILSFFFLLSCFFFLSSFLSFFVFLFLPSPCHFWSLKDNFKNKNKNQGAGWIQFRPGRKKNKKKNNNFIFFFFFSGFSGQGGSARADPTLFLIHSPSLLSFLFFPSPLYKPSLILPPSLFFPPLSSSFILRRREKEEREKNKRGKGEEGECEGGRVREGLYRGEGGVRESGSKKE